RGNVPGLQTFFPKTIKPAAGNIREIKRRGAIAAHSLRVHDEVRKVPRKLATLAHVVRKACAEQRSSQAVNWRHLNAATVKRRAFAALSRKHFIPQRIIHNPHFHASFVLESDRNAEARIA